MPKTRIPKRPQKNKKTTMQGFATHLTERNILIVLAAILVICVGILLFRTQRDSRIIDPVIVEQPQN